MQCAATRMTRSFRETTRVVMAILWHYWGRGIASHKHVWLRRTRSR
jgi:hypothetical protein